MQVHTTRIHVHTYDGVSMQDVAPDLGEYIYHTGVESGLCVVSASHPDFGITLSDDVDERYSDLLLVTRQLIGISTASGPGADDRVDEVAIGDALAAFAANTLTLPIRAGALALGSWEAVLLLESRGPAARQLDVTILGD